MEAELLGRKVQIKKRLSYKEKVEWAKELVGKAGVFDDSGVAYWGHLKEAVCLLITLKAYTDLDVSAYESEEGLMNLMDEDSHYACDDIDDQRFLFEMKEDQKKIYALAEMMFANAAKVHEKQCSLENKIKESFGFLLEGRDLTEALSQAKEVNEQMIDHLGSIAQLQSLLNKQKAPVDLAQYAKKKK